MATETPQEGSGNAELAKSSQEMADVLEFAENTPLGTPHPALRVETRAETPDEEVARLMPAARAWVEQRVASPASSPPPPAAAAPPPVDLDPPPDETQQARTNLLADLNEIIEHGGITPLLAGRLSQTDLPKVREALITETIPGEMVKAKVTPNDSLWGELGTAFSRETVARIEFAVFCRMRDLPAEEWQKFFEEENIQHLEPRIAALADKSTRVDYAALLQLRAENAEQEQEPGADEGSIDRFISDNPALARDLFAQGGQDLTDAFDALRNNLGDERLKNNFLWAVTRAAGITPDDLKALEQMEAAAVDARQEYESSASTEKFIKKINTAVAYYRSDSEIRSRRASCLQRLASGAGLKFNADGLLEEVIERVRPVSAPPPPRPAEAVPALTVPEFTPGNQLMQSFDNALRETHDPSPAIEVFPDTLAQFLKEAVKIPVSKLLPITAGFPSTPVLRPVSIDGEEALLFSGSITAPGGAEVIFDQVLVINSPRGEGLAVSYRAQDIVYRGKADEHRDKVKATLDHFGQDLIEGINARLRNKNWQVSGLHIQNGRLRFNFARRRQH